MPEFSNLGQPGRNDRTFHRHVARLVRATLEQILMNLVLTSLFIGTSAGPGLNMSIIGRTTDV